MKKVIQRITAAMLALVFGMMTLSADVIQVHAEEEKEVKEFDLTSYDPLGLGEETMKYVGNGRKDIVDYPGENGISPLTVNGQGVHVVPGEHVSYGSWGTNKFDVDGHLGYCAQPKSPTPSGWFTAYELNNDMIKVALMCAPGGPLDGKIGGYPAGSIFYDPNVPGGNMYANAHAVIGYIYSGDLTGLGYNYQAGIRNMAQLVRNILNNNTGAIAPEYAMDRWKVFIAPNNSQDIVWLEGAPANGTVRLTKTSANVELTNGNSCYSLEGAYYGIWKNQACTEGTGLSFTTNKDGVANLNGTLPAGTYYVKEVTAPKGYALDKTVYQVQVVANQTAQLNVKDFPQSDPTRIVLGKVDKETNQDKPQGSATLEGAEFTVKYYQGLYDADPEKDGKKAERTWVLRTREDGKTALDNRYKVSGDEFYYTSKGEPTLPIGTIVIQETKAPEGYLLNEEIFIRQIKPEGIEEQVETYNMPTIPEQSLNLDIVKKLVGTDLAIPDVVFKHTLPDGTTETVTTDKDGKAAIKALTWGTHIIEETSVPDGFTKNPGKVTFTVAKDNTIEVTSNTASDKTGKMTFTVKDNGCAELVVEDTYAPYKLLLTKNNEKGKVLQGAEFTLYSDKECKQEVTKGVTQENGTLEFAKLEVEKKYYLKETKAPDGYRIPVNTDGSAIVTEIYTQSSPLDDVFEYYVNGTKHTEKDGIYAITGTKADRVVNLTVVNNTGNKLPKTGTHTTLILVVLGIGCMAGALIYANKKGKKEEKENEKNEKN